MSDDAPRQPGRVRRVWRALTRHRGRFGFATGLVAGAAAGALVATLLPGALRPGDDLEPGPLVILSGKDDSNGGQRQALLDQWNALHPANPARIEELPRQADAQHSEMVARAQSGVHPVDIYNVDVTAIAEFAHAGYLRPLRDGTDTAGFLAAPLSTCRYAGQLWALPFNSDAGLLFYRTDLVPVPPTTLTALTGDIASGLAASHDKRLVAGYAGQLADYEGLTVNALEAIWAAGGDVVDSAGHVVLDSRETRTGLRWLANGLAPGTPQAILPQSARFDETQSTQAFYDRQVLFLRMWPVAYRTLQAQAATPAPSGAAGPPPFNVTGLPGPSVLGGQDLAIARGTRRPRAAQALVEFLTSERSQQILFERGGFAATREIVYHDAQVLDRYRYAPVLLDALRAARPRPVTPHYPRFTEVFRTIVLSALRNGGQLPPDATRSLADALRGY